MDTIDQIDLRALRMLQLTAQQGGFSAAARRLGVARAVVSREIAALEATLGVRLFERTTRRMVPTAEAEALLQRLGGHVEEIRRGLLQTRSAAADAEGPVRISAGHGFGRRFILPALSSLRRTHPGIQVEMGLSEEVEDLIAGEFDLAIRLGPLPDSTLTARRLGELPQLFVVHASHEIADPDSIDQVLALPAIGFRLSGTGRLYRWEFERTGERRQIDHRTPIAIVNSVEAVADLVIAGLGAAPVHDYLVRPALQAGRLRQLLPGYRLAAVPVHLCHTGRDMMPRRVQIVADHVGEFISRALRSKSGPPVR